MKDLLFIPYDWDIDTDAHSTVASAVKVSGYDNKKIDGWQIGDWWYNWSTIYSDFHVTPGETYCFHFWLNGGENDKHDEICDLEIFGEDWSERQTFSLNRNHTKPVKYLNGWYLFSIVFTAPDEFITIRFNVQKAVATIVPATVTDLEIARTLPSDPENTDKPQRKNIVFKNGWPVDPNEAKILRITLGERELTISKDHLVIGLIVLLCAVVLLSIARRQSKG